MNIRQFIQCSDTAICTAWLVVNSSQQNEILATRESPIHLLHMSVYLQSPAVHVSMLAVVTRKKSFTHQINRVCCVI